MRLGFLTAPFPDTPLMEVADWAATSGFEVLEIACWPRSAGPTRRYAGTSHIDVANLSAGQARDLRAEIEAKGLAISGLGFYPNPLHPDPEPRSITVEADEPGRRAPLDPGRRHRAAEGRWRAWGAARRRPSSRDRTF